jgi:hypothetical protein
MREVFKSVLLDHRDLANNEPEEDAAFERQLAELFQKSAARLGTDEEAQAKIYELQQRKQDIMDQLKAGLAKLDDSAAPVEQLAGAREVVCDNGSYVCYHGSEPQPITLGELLTDGEWNDDNHGIAIKYHLNDSVDRRVRKKYLLEEAKRALRGCLDRQILTNEIASRKTDAWKKEAYANIAADHENGTDKLHSGLIAEKMVRNFLKKVSLDCGGDFEIIEADVYQDVAQKIDFIIHRKDAGRGVKVAEGDKNHVGVQFTINPQAKKHKEEQVSRANAKLRPEDRVDSIVLVTMRLDNVMRIFSEWAKTKTAGGPDKLWSAREKTEIFRGLMKNFLTEPEIAAYCAKFN